MNEILAALLSLTLTGLIGYLYVGFLRAKKKDSLVGEEKEDVDSKETAQPRSKEVKVASYENKLIEKEIPTPLSFHKKSLDSILTYITKDEPFGPIDSAQIESYGVLDLLFEKQSRVYKSMQSRPSIIMGRRGSGKTSLLKSVYFHDQYQYVVEITTARTIEHISSVIQSTSSESTYVESISKLWENTLWTCVLNVIRRRNSLVSENIDIIDEYLKKLGIQKSDSTDTILWKLELAYIELLEKNPKNGLLEILRQFDQKDFENVKFAAIEYLNANKAKIIILMDSLEEFHISIESIGRAIRGLLHLAGSMNKPNDVVDIRLCLPTELKQIIYDLAVNPIKDFRNLVMLEWTASDLILIGAQRLLYFLWLYYPNLVKEKFKSPFDELSRSGALDLFNMVLPNKIKTQSHFSEFTISYILRHTQLLPRHFLLLLNSIFRNAKATQVINPFPLQEEDIINGVRQVEEPMVNEIFSAFQTFYANARDVCRTCFPELENVFPLGRLHQIYNRKGKAVFNWGEFDDFYRMLVDIGAVGKVSKKTALYIISKFQYTIGHELSITDKDDLCLHPLFSGVYSDSGEVGHLIYPEGEVFDNE